MTAVDFKGRVAIVTGAGRSVGREYALEIARRGGKVVVADLGGVGQPGGAWADAVVAEIAAAGGSAAATTETVATASGGEAIAEVALSRFGRIDAVIHNAGFLRPAFVEDMTERKWQEVLDVHLNGAFYLTKPAWSHMRSQGYGRVVLTSSASIFGYEASCNYVAAKAGLFGLATALATEGRRYNINVNTILPFMDSNIVTDNPPVGAIADTAKLAMKALAPRRTAPSVSPLGVFLASEACTRTGRAYSALSGRYARVALDLARGWISESNTATAEDMLENLARIEDMGDSLHPERMTDEVEAVYADLSAKGVL